MFFARWIEHALDVSVQRPHDANARERRRAAEFDHEDQRVDWAHERAVDDQARFNGASRHARVRACTSSASESLNVFDPDRLPSHQKWTSVRIPRTTALSVFTPTAL